jgi:hypothetical protein
MKALVGHSEAPGYDAQNHTNSIVEGVEGRQAGDGIGSRQRFFLMELVVVAALARLHVKGS